VKGGTLVRKFPKFGKKNRQGNEPVIHTLPGVLEPYRAFIPVQFSNDFKGYGFVSIEAALNVSEKFVDEKGDPVARSIRDSVVSKIEYLSILHREGGLATSDIENINVFREAAGLAPVVPYDEVAAARENESDLAGVDEKSVEAYPALKGTDVSLEDERKAFHEKRREDEAKALGDEVTASNIIPLDDERGS